MRKLIVPAVTVVAALSCAGPAFALAIDAFSGKGTLTATGAGGVFGSIDHTKVIGGERDTEVFGDGTVVLVSAPGHTPGHQVLLLRLANTGPLLLSGDLYHFAESRALRRAPTFNHDAEQTFASMDKVEALIAAEGATLWIEHEMALAETLDLAPAFYD